MWVDGKRHGDGVYRWPDGSAYVGQYEADQRQGTGSMMDMDGSSYKGQWCMDKKHGNIFIY